MTIEEAQQSVDRWVKTYGVRYFSELTNMAVLTEEVGELARVMARKYGDQSFKEGEKDNIFSLFSSYIIIGQNIMRHNSGKPFILIFDRNISVG